MSYSAALLAVGFLLVAGDLASQVPTELGKVSWLRDHDKALARSRRTHTPVFLLFQEVPG